MASLKETKGRINSVKSTLKITSAMKMVASAKLRKAQNAIESMLPYEHELQDMLRMLLSALPVGEQAAPATQDASAGGTVAIVAFSSNSSLCGAFNSNVIKETKARVKALTEAGSEVEVISVGKKMAEAMKKSGYPSADDWSELVAHSSYESSDVLAKKLQNAYKDGKYSRIELIYNHFISTASQKPVCATYLPMDASAALAGSSQGSSAGRPEDLIIEPTAQEMLDDLMPMVQSLRIYTVILDTCAAEHAARTVAMQTATDNGENILQDLTLEYNKGRQQKITNEILDIVGGSMQ